MQIRPAVCEDIHAMMFIINQAKESLRERGIDQWQDGYPEAEDMMEDIVRGDSYVATITDTREGSFQDAVAGVAAISFHRERTYDQIQDGAWKTDKDSKYAVIHRIAVANGCKGGGLANAFIRKAEQLCQQRGAASIRIDTHEDNKSMQRFLEKNGFAYCGIIYLESGAKRLAFEKIVLASAGE